MGPGDTFDGVGTTSIGNFCPDDVPPEISCPPDIELCEEGGDTGFATATDNCDLQ